MSTPSNKILNHKHSSNNPHEVLIPESLKQCRVDADVLLDNFRNDVSCDVLKQFKAKGVSLENLLDLQMVVPILYPWDEEYNNLKYNVNRKFVMFPLAIVMAETTKHIEITVEWAYKRNIQIAIRSGGHCFENFSLTNNGIIVDQSQRTNIEVHDNIAIVESGVLQGPLQLELSKKNLAFVGGTCNTVAVSGLSLGGGIGFLARKYGLASDNLLEAEIVLYNGDVIRTNSKENNDLFWALRGAGNSNFGIVTELVFKLHHIPEVCIFDLIFPYDSMIEIIDIWQHWAPFTDYNLTSELNVSNDRVLVTGQFIGSKEDLKKLIQPLIQLNPEEYSIQKVPFIDAVRKFATERFYPFFKAKNGFVKRSLSLQAIEIIYKYMKCAGNGDEVALDAFNGTISKVPVNKTAFPHRGDTLYWIHLQANWRNQESIERKLTWITNFYNELQPYLSGVYANAPDIDLTYPLEKYYASNLPRLKEIKKKYDPENIFRYSQSIPPK